MTTEPFDRHSFMTTRAAQIEPQMLGVRFGDLITIIADTISQSEAKGAEVAVAALRVKAEAWTNQYLEGARAYLLSQGVDPDDRRDSFQDMTIFTED